MSCATHGTPDARLTAQVLQQHDRPGPRYTSYPTAVEFHEGFGPDDYARHLRELGDSGSPVALYMHLPFCAKRCLYCACHVVISPYKHKADPYIDRLLREIDLVADAAGTRVPVQELHWGGGTPTYFDPDQLARLMAKARDRFDVRPDAELSVEVDPRVTTDAHLERLAELRFGRISVGVQDFDPKVQETIGRVQSVAQTRATIEKARALGFHSVNADLVYGLPHQNAEGFGRTLEETIAIRPDRLAVYSFAYVPWMMGHQKKLPEEAIPQAEARYGLLALVRDMLLDAGYVDIGMDHFALPEDPLTVAQREGRLHRNFMGYTTTSVDDMIGLGSSAIGYVRDAYVQNRKKLKHYLDDVDAGRLPVQRGYALSDDDRLRKFVIGELMCNFVVHKREVEARFGVAFDDVFADELADLVELEREEMVVIAEDRVEAVGWGRTFIRNVAMVFDRYLRERRAESGGPRFSRTL